MARHPEWFERLDVICEVVRQAGGLPWLGRSEIKAIFGCSERDSIRLLHKFGAEEQDNVLSLPRAALLTQLQAIRAGATYSAFLRQRHEVARQLTTARAEAAARQFHVMPAALRRNIGHVFRICRKPSTGDGALPPVQAVSKWCTAMERTSCGSWLRF